MGNRREGIGEGGRAGNRTGGDAANRAAHEDVQNHVQNDAQNDGQFDGARYGVLPVIRARKLMGVAAEDMSDELVMEVSRHAEAMARLIYGSRVPK